MPRWNSALNAKLDDYGEYLRSRKCQPRTVTEYRRLVVNAFGALHEAGLNHSVRTIGEEEIDFLYNELYEPVEPRTARNQVSVIGTFLKRMGKNPVVELMDIPWPADLRIHVKWLDPMRAISLRRAASDMERILVHFELDCMMRRCEVMRLRVGDVASGAIDIWGKGRDGGKPRTIPWHPRTQTEWEHYLLLREDIVERARKKNPQVMVPEQVLIYERNGRLGCYQKTAVDRMIKEAGARAGILPDDISNHVLRRTGARISLLGGTQISTIMKILGHSTEEQTIRYLGLNLDDMSKGMNLAERYLQEIETKMIDVPATGTSPIQLAR